MKNTLFYLVIFLFPQIILACDPPTDAHVGGQNGISANLLWASVPDAVLYEARLYRLDYQDTLFRQTANSPTNIGGLMPFTTYVFSVRAKCTDNIWSDWSNFYILTTTGGGSGGGNEPTIEKCVPPINLSAEQKTPTSFELHWFAVQAAIEYEIEVRNLADSLLFLKKSTNNFIEINDLNTSGKYKFRVRSICTNEQTNWTSFFTFGRADDAKLRFKIMPNPTTENIEIDLAEFQKAALNLLIFNDLGQQMRDFSFLETHQNSEILLLENLPSGTYFLKIISGKSTSDVARFCVARR